MIQSEDLSVVGYVAEAPSAWRSTSAVALAHAEIDRQTQAFRDRTGLSCPEGCGACCRSPNVETTVVDVLPLAEEVVRRGLAGALLERLEGRTNDARCVLYDPEASDPNRGRCSMYAWRPSICRLFGFAGRRDADGRPQFVACRVHKDISPDRAAATAEAVRAGDIPLPIFADLAGQVSALAPGAGTRPQSINVALGEAIRAAALAERLADAMDREGAYEDDHDGDGERGGSRTPRVPRRPKRRAA